MRFRPPVRWLVALALCSVAGVALGYNRFVKRETAPPPPIINKADDAAARAGVQAKMTKAKKQVNEPWLSYWLHYPASEILQLGLSIEVSNGFITGVAPAEGDQTKYDILGIRYSPGDLDATDITPTLWRTVDLTLDKPDGSEAKLRVLRPLWWFVETDAKLGEEIDLSMHEVGLEGLAKVEQIGPCTIDSRTAPKDSVYVIGKIEHHNAEVWDLVFNQDSAHPVGVTANHPIRSADRNDWVPAGDLRIDERVVATDGTAKLTGKSKRANRETVYNLEVHRSHAYQVSQFGILAHNTGIGCTIPYSSKEVGRAAKALKSGATEVRVASRSQAEELFLRMFQGDGYKNTTGWARAEVKRFGKANTYHWDDSFEGVSKAFPGRSILKGHYDDGKLHSYTKHLQIHTATDVLRILFD